MSLKHILVATDLSAVSLLSLPWVAGLASATGAQVTVAYIDDVAGSLEGDDFDEEVKGVREHLGIFRDALGMLDVACEVRVLSGKATDVLERLSAQGEHDLLVTTRHGERATGLLVGSTSLHLARRCKIPLLVVHGPATDEVPMERTTVVIREVLTTTDFSDASNAGVAALLPLVRDLSANLHIVHVVATPGAVIDVATTQLTLPHTPISARQAVHIAETRLSVFANELDHDQVSTQVICAEVAADGIVAAALLRESDLIAIASHGKGAIASILLGSTSRRVLTLSPIPVLVMQRDSISGAAWGLPRA